MAPSFDRLPFSTTPEVARADDEPIALACPVCGSLRTRLVEVDVIARIVTLQCRDCGAVSRGVRY